MAGLSVVPMESALSANTPAIGAHERAEVGNELQSVLLDLIDLSLLGKQLPSRGTIRGTKRTGLHLPAAGPGGNAAQSQSRLNSCQTGHPGHCQLPLHTREVAGSKLAAPRWYRATARFRRSRRPALVATSRSGPPLRTRVSLLPAVCTHASI
jgi:hypothetical protein